MPYDTRAAEVTLQLQDVAKFFGDLVALQGIRLEIAPGDAVLLYGPNGAGKTTLLRTLAGLSHPTEGKVLFAGQDFHRKAAAAKARIGFVSHATFLYGELTARENLRFTGRLFGLEGLERKIHTALDLFGVRDRANTKSASSSLAMSSSPKAVRPRNPMPWHCPHPALR